MPTIAIGSSRLTGGRTTAGTADDEPLSCSVRWVASVVGVGWLKMMVGEQVSVWWWF